MGLNLADVVCEDCGVLMVGVAAHRKRCPACAATRFQEQKKQANERQKIERWRANCKVKGKTALADPTYCRGCIHLGFVACMPCCNYIFNEDRRRPCPAGEGCTAKETRRKRERKAKKEQKPTIDLLPCKRCGGSAKMFSYRDEKAATNPTYIQCTRCGESTALYNRKYKAIVAWNGGEYGNK